jgi:intracellular sulfur oxidation DsrE/DsrF family protein
MKHLLAVALFALSASVAMAEGQTHYVAVHVDQNDPVVMNIALNNVQNLVAYYRDQGDDAVVELVTHGPGLEMLIPDKSPVADRISVMALELGDSLTFAACGNTLAGLEKKAGHEIALMDEAEVVPSGVVRLVELQEQGYAYVRP